MTETLYVNANGYYFTFIVSNEPTECGVIIHPDSDTDDPAFIEALSAALGAHHIYVDITQINEILRIGQTKDLANWQGISLIGMLEQIDRVLSQHSFPLANDDTKRYREMRDRLQYEIDRRQDASKATAAELARKRAWMKKAGYVYLIESSHGVYKIGLTGKPEDRIATFGILLPFTVEYVCLIQTEDMRSLEKALHDRYASKRINGEWFALDADDVEYIKSLAQVQA